MFTDIETIETTKAIISTSEDGHIIIRIKAGLELDVEDIKEISAAKDKLAGGEKNTVIFVVGTLANITNEAREFSATPAVYHNAIAKAIVVNDLAAKMIGNFFIRFNRPPAPTKLFSSEKEASAWLLKIKNQDN